MMSSYRREITDKTIEFYALPAKNLESVVFDLNGNKLKTIASENENVKKNKTRTFDNAYVKSVVDEMLKPSDWVHFGDYNYRHSNSEYQIDIADRNEKIIKSYKRPFNRVDFILNEKAGFIRISNKKQEAMLNAKYRDEL